ncbi:MAG: hypothetical protein WCF19_04085 [Chlamydiales bacterium]
MCKIGLYFIFLLSIAAATADESQSQLLTDWGVAGNFFRTAQGEQKEAMPPRQANNPPPSRRYLKPYPGHCPSLMIGGDIALALDGFRSLPDGSWAGNSGAFASLNLAIGIPKEKYGFGAQLGGSYGLYDWNGRGSTTTENSKTLQQQGFITAGLFRVTPHSSGFNGGIVYDLMLNKEFGVFALSPILGQIRGQFGYLIQGGNEIGVWGAVDTQTAHEVTSEIPVRFRSICQVSIYWLHSFKNTAETMLWAGTPYRRGLMFSSGRAGNYLFGASFRAPLTRALSVIGHGSYMGSHSGSAFQESSNYASNVCFGLNYSFGGCKAGQRPYLPLADNSHFMVDTNLNE